MSSSSSEDESEGSRRSEAPLRSPDGLHNPIPLRRNSLPLAIDVPGIDGERPVARRYSIGNANRLFQLRQEDSPKEAFIREVKHEKGVTSTYQLSRSWEEGLHLDSNPLRRESRERTWDERVSVHSSPCPSPSPAIAASHATTQPISIPMRSGRVSESGSPVLSPLPSPLAPTSPAFLQSNSTRPHITLKRKLSDEHLDGQYGSPPKRPNTRPYRSSSLGISSSGPALSFLSGNGNGIHSPPSSVESLGSPGGLTRTMLAAPTFRMRSSPTGSDKVFGEKPHSERRLPSFDPNAMDTDGKDENDAESYVGVGVGGASRSAGSMDDGDSDDGPSRMETEAMAHNGALSGDTPMMGLASARGEVLSTPEDDDGQDASRMETVEGGLGVP